MAEARETRVEIMEATFEALVEHGYAGLTIQTIADEFEKSKSLLYYHFDTKDDLLTGFLGYVTDEFDAHVQADVPDGATPEERLTAALDILVPRDLTPDDRRFRTALLELRLQSPYNEAYAERFAALDERLEATFAAILADGVEEGTFDVDPETAAHALTSAAIGEMLRIVTGASDPGTARDAIDATVGQFRP